MASSNRLNRQWCGTHGMYYPAWVDAKHSQLGTCFKCDDEKERAAVFAAERRALLPEFDGTSDPAQPEFTA